MPLSKEEVNRKLFHMAALLMPAGIFYVPILFDAPQWIAIVILGGLLAASLAMEAVRFRFPAFQGIFHGMFHSMLRQEENHKITGSTWYIASATICAVVFYPVPHIAFMSLSLFIVGDAAAAIVGIAYGRTRIGKKTLEGSAACFFASLFIFILFPLLPLLPVAPFGRSFTALLTSLVITLFELIPIRIGNKLIINDNLIVPVIGGLLIWVLETWSLS